MKGTVNPFEPWRPPAERTPPPLHAGRPWRPPSPPPVLAAVEEEPPFVEPVKPRPRKKTPQRPKRPQRQPGEPSLWRIVAAVVVYSALVSFGFGSVGLLEDAHAPRFLAMILCAGLLGGCVVGNRLLQYYTRLAGNQEAISARLTIAGIAAALALAGMALWFVPTSNGVSLWSAYRQVEELRTLPAGDVAGYQRDAAIRKRVVEGYPSFAADISAAEQAWLRRTVEEAIENADRRIDKEPDAALVNLHRLDQTLPELKNYDSIQKDLASARRRAVQACIKAAQQP